MFETRVTEKLGIKYPIVQGGMMWLSRAELVSAVSNAGGLGILAALTFPEPAGLVEEIKKTRRLTKKPFAVNMTFLPTLSEVNYDLFIDTIINEGIEIVETAGRLPEQYIKKFKSAGVKIIHKCTTIKHARKAESLGCDILSMDGFECAGHPGEEDVTSLVLTPIAASSLKIPVITSGGIADARGFVAALALGAEGINMGTRFMLTREAPVHPKIKEWLLTKRENDTMLLLRPYRNTERAVKSEVTEKVAEMEREGTTIEQIAHLVSGYGMRALIEDGDIDKGTLTAGQSLGLINDIPSVKQVIDGIIEGAKKIITGRLARFI